MDTLLDTRLQASFKLRKHGETYSVICSVPRLGKLRVSTGITVPPALWDKASQRCKGKLPYIARINSRLADLEHQIAEALLAPDPRAAVLEVLGRKTEDRNLLFPFFHDWVMKGTATKLRYDRQNLYSYNMWKSILPEDTSFDQVDYNLYTSSLEELRARGLRENSIGQHIKTLKAVMNEAYRRGLHTNLAFLRFSKPHEETDAVYLTAEELQKIKDLSLSGHLEKARDLFLLGVYTAMRFSDYSRIRPHWIKGGNLVFTEEKTGNRNSIPLSSSARSVIEKYKGAPSLSQQKLNTYIKKVCRMAGLTDGVEVSYTKGGRKCKEVREKCNLVSTHTARRTGASLLVRAGAPVAWVMRVTGHRSERSFMNYVRISSEEYAELMRSYVDRL